MFQKNIRKIMNKALHKEVCRCKQMIDESELSTAIAPDIQQFLQGIQKMHRFTFFLSKAEKEDELEFSTAMDIQKMVKMNSK
ncbi:hypothetical protein RIF29_19705 [Crotalaria pallida]|uniref:Uncharacterized protein n=1 Tax=Crotalaria pallida TaxID=3830 RepID=A0AAN9IBN5_CROPI